MTDQYGYTSAGWSLPTDRDGTPIAGPIEHPRAVPVLVLGVLGLLCFGMLAPIAWAMGVRVVEEIDRSGGYLGGRHQARAGTILGVVGTLLMIVWALLFTLMLLR